MADLNGQTIAATYSSLLKFSDNGVIEADAVQVISDGRGTATSLWLSTLRASIVLGGTAGDDFIVDGGTFVVEGDTNRVGIGTASSDTELHLVGDFTIDSGGGGAADKYLFNPNASDDGLHLSSRIANGNFSSALMSWKHDGKVGIGTTASVNTFQVNHSAANNDNGIMIVNEATTIANGALLGAIGFDGADGEVPSSVLESSCFIAAYAAEDHSAGAKGGELAFGSSLISEADDTTSTKHMTITAAGNVLIGNAAVASAVKALILLNGTGAGSAITNSAGIFVSGGDLIGFADNGGNTTLAAASSDERLKDNIVLIPGALSRLVNIKGVTFNYVPFKDSTLSFKDDIPDEQEYSPYELWGDAKRVGVIAQSVEVAYDGLDITNSVINKPITEAKGENPKVLGDSKQIDMLSLIPLLIEAVKELSAKVTALENA